MTPAIMTVTVGYGWGTDRKISEFINNMCYEEKSMGNQLRENIQEGCLWGDKKKEKESVMWTVDKECLWWD